MIANTFHIFRWRSSNVLKPLFVCLTLSANVLFAQSYITKVQSLYLATQNKPIGRILPSVEVKTLGEVDGKVEIEVSGWIEDGVPSAIYFAPNRRILVAGINKTTQYDFKSLDSTEDGGKKWLLIKAKFLTEKTEFSNDVNAMYKGAEEMYSMNCSICHKLHDKKEFSANQWPSIINSMLSRTAISKDESYLLIQYLQKNAKDMPYKK